MKKADLKYLCTLTGNLSGIPIRVYDGDEQIFFHSLAPLPWDPIRTCEKELLEISSHIGYFITETLSYYGLVNSGHTKIILGPSRQIPFSEQELRTQAFFADVPPPDIDAFIAGMKTILPMPLESVLQMLCTINFVLNGEKLELKDIAIHDGEQEQLKAFLHQKHAERSLSFSLESEVPFHNTYEVEQTMLGFVRRGDTHALREWLASVPAIRSGVLAADQLRQIKNTFVVTTSLVSRAAIRGGLDINDAFSLSDSYIQRCELLDSPDRITNLQYHMILEYTELVERVRFGKSPSKLTIAVANYVQHHISEAITAENIAKEFYMSRPYLSSKFKDETGVTLTDFILKEKTEEAKRLLRYTDKTAAAIGVYLGFSSQGHFSRVFKKYVSITPHEYREKYTH